MHPARRGMLASRVGCPQERCLARVPIVPHRVGRRQGTEGREQNARCCMEDAGGDHSFHLSTHLWLLATGNPFCLCLLPAARCDSITSSEWCRRVQGAVCERTVPF